MSVPIRIPITMCHGLRPPEPNLPKPLDAAHFRSLIKIASDLGFESINYNDLEAWRAGKAPLPPRPIMFDFDHAVLSMLEVHNIMADYGYRGTLFVHTAPLEGKSDGMAFQTPYMTWDQIGSLMDAGWLIGAHTVTHPNLSKLYVQDPSGQKLRDELDTCDATIEKHLGWRPRDFAYTGTSFSTAAEAEAKKRYRFARLWITQAMYNCDGGTVRYADLVNVPGDDEPDGGPPIAARYITRDSPSHRLPSMEIQALIYTPEAFRAYLEGALTPTRSAA